MLNFPCHAFSVVDCGIPEWYEAHGTWTPKSVSSCMMMEIEGIFYKDTFMAMYGPPTPWWLIWKLFYRCIKRSIK